ncbi:hypothetical protein BDR26DRAFT_930641 [Obelidium mucronatum]|nr:hypothetical protein BDR26DRAFT_930641 [Obelidium mucronatum]
MSQEKKGFQDSHQFKKGLSFEASTPNFLKVLQSQHLPKQPVHNKDNNNEDDDDEEQEDAQDLDDEAPQVVLGKNVNKEDAVRALGLKHAGSLQVSERGGTIKHGKKRATNDVLDDTSSSSTITTAAPLNTAKTITEIGGGSGGNAEKKRKRIEEIRKKIDASSTTTSASKKSSKNSMKKDKKMLSFDADGDE